MVTISQWLVTDVLKLARSGGGPTLSERELLEQSVEFANSGALTGALLHIPGLLLPKRIMEDSLERGLHVAIYVAGNPQQAKWLEQFREDLASCFTAADRLPFPTANRLKKEAGRMVMVPTYAMVNGSLRVTYHFLPESLPALLAYAILVLRDESKEFKADFARCKLARCGKYFFISEVPQGPGRHRKSYCCAEHMKEQHKSTGAERVKKHRAAKKKKESQASGSGSDEPWRLN